MSRSSMTKAALLWGQIRSSLWFIPALLTAFAVVLAFVTIWIDRHEWARVRQTWFLFAAGAEGARGVLSTIAGSVITVTGVVFSITIVVLQLASSQFTPRVLRSFTDDRANQVVLGVFIGTFTYALLVLRSVRSAVEDYERFVPSISVTVALILALVSIGCLIFFINHIARSIQAEMIMQRVTADARNVIEELFPETVSDVRGNRDRDAAATAPVEHPVALCARGSGYIQAVDEDQLVDLAEMHDLVIRMEKAIGDFVIEGDALLLLSRDELPGGEIPPALMERLPSAIHLGPERTRYQDVARGLIELTDIGTRALSPGINDSTTALVCIDRVSELMALLGSRKFAEPFAAGEDGRVRLIARRTTFHDLVHLAYGPLRHHGAGIPAAAVRLAHSLRDLAERVSPDRREPVLAELTQLVETARTEVKSVLDIERIEAAARLDHTRPPSPALAPPA